MLLGNGDGSFSPAVQYAVGNLPGFIVSGDFNDDGHTDLAVSCTSYPIGTVSVLLGNGDGTFQAMKSFATGFNPEWLEAGDFNGDGRTDLAALTYGSSTGSVFLSNGDGTFQAATTFAAGLYPASLVAADLNGDGKLDLAVADQGIDVNGSGVSVLLGNGDGSFQAPKAFAVAKGGPIRIVAGDFNGDGRLDLATGNLNTEDVSVLLGNGDGTFQTQQQRFSVAGGPSSMVAGDFSDDGRLDLAVGTYAGVEELLGNGDGTLQPAVFYGTGYAQSIVAGDWNGDGRLDQAVATYAGVEELLGNGDGRFQAQPVNQTGSAPLSEVTADFNGDGRLDVVTTNQADDTISVLLGDGDGTFEPELTFAAGDNPIALVSGDFNGDGRLDLGIINSGIDDFVTGYEIIPGYLSVLLGNGDGTFQAPMRTTVDAFQYPGALVAEDFNGDGRLDLAVADAGNDFYGGTNPGGVFVLLGKGDGTFKPAERYASVDYDGAGPWLVEGDFNGDGRLDLATAATGGDTVRVLLGNGDGTFQSTQSVVLADSVGSLTTGDFNGDGVTDFVVASFAYPSNTVSVLLGNGDGTFQTEQPLAAGVTLPSAPGPDFNGDGIGDMIAVDLNSQAVTVQLGNGDGTFVDPGQLATTPHAAPILADSNGDGTDDVLVVNSAGAILYRQGTPGQPGSFEPPITINPGFPSRDIAYVSNSAQGPLIASVDAKDDAVSLYAWRDGGFIRVNSLATGRLPAQVVSADLNGDGSSDLVVRNAGDGSLTVLFATKFIGPIDPGSFPVSFVAHLTIPVGLGVSDVQLVDTTGSGVLDLVVTNKLTGQATILRNLGHGNFAPPATYRAGTGLSTIDTSSGSAVIAAREATAGVAAGSFASGAFTELATINPGSNTLDVLAGLGGGRFANPITLETKSPAQVVRGADFNHDGVPDLAILGATSVSVYLGNSAGGFGTPVSYDAGPDPSGLTIGDVNHDGSPDLLIGNAARRCSGPAGPR